MSSRSESALESVESDGDHREARAPVQSLDLARAVADLRSASPADILALQSGYGNRLVARLVEGSQQAVAAPPMVRQGSRGPDVVRLQEKLNDRGKQLATDGAFGPRTRAAVVEFQSSSGLTADGVVGPMTWNALGSAGPSPGGPGSTPGTTPGTTPGAQGETPGSHGETPGTEPGTAPPGPQAAPPEDAPPQPTPEDAGGQRAAALALAIGETGKVESNAPGEVDQATGKRTRRGWERLDLYFETSYGGRDGQYGPALQSLVKFHGAGKVQSWCGHFAVWALKSAGVPLGNWKIGTGISNMVKDGRSPRNYTPRPGDIGYIDQPYQHHCLVVRVEGDTVVTIDGNTSGAGGATGGQIAENRRPLNSFSAFYIPPGLD